MKDINDYAAPRFLADFLNYMQTIKGKSANTAKVYFYDLRLFLRFLMVHFKLVPGGLEHGPDGFDSIDIANFSEDILKRVTLSELYAFMSFASRQRENSSSARARKAASIRSFFNYAHTKAKLLESNPAAELESPKIVKRLPRYLDVDESRQLLSTVEGSHRERDYAIITLFLNCGMRLSELVGINVSDMRGDVITIIGKGDKERSVHINKACLEALDEYIKVRPANGVKDREALFLSERKTRISKNMVQRIVKRNISAAGLDPRKYSTHKLRHTAATLMYRHGGVDIRALQEILGHESISTTEIYTHLDDARLKNAVDSNPLADFTRKGGYTEG